MKRPMMQEMQVHPKRMAIVSYWLRLKLDGSVTPEGDNAFFAAAPDL